MSESENFGLTKVLDGLRSVLNARSMTSLQSGQYINDYTSSVSNYSGIFDKNNSYKKFDIVYNTGDGTYYYARDDLTAGLGVSITEANRFSLEATAPTVPDAKHSPIGYYLFDENNLLTKTINQRIEAGNTIQIGGSLSGNNGNYRVLAVDQIERRPGNATGTLTGALDLTIAGGAKGLAERAAEGADRGHWYDSSWLFRTMLGTDRRELASIEWNVSGPFDYAKYVDQYDDVTAGYNSQSSNYSKIEYGRFHWENFGINQSYREMPERSRFIYNNDFGRMLITPSHETNKELWFQFREGESNSYKTFWASTGTMGTNSQGGKGLAWMQEAGDGKLGPTGWTHWEEDTHFSSTFGTKIRMYNFANQKWYSFKGAGVRGTPELYEDITSRVSAPTAYPLVGSPGDSPATETQDYESPSYAPEVQGVTRLWLESADSTSAIEIDEPAASNEISLTIQGADPSVNPDSWSTNLFFFDADYGSRAIFKANNKRYEYGNGYYILQPKNINSLSAEFDLAFKNRTSREAAAMVHFLEHHLGQHEAQTDSPNLRYKLGISGFRWDGASTYHPYDSIENQTRQFYCTDFNHSLNFDDSNDINIKLRNLNASLLNKSQQIYVNSAETYDASTSYELNDVVFYTGNHQYYYWHSEDTSSNKPPAESAHAGWSTVSGYYVDLNTGYWTRDFFWRPSIGLQVSHQPRVQSITTNGYTQIYNDGINENLLNLDLNFNGRDDAECAAILHYLEAHQGCIPFRFCPPAPYDQVSNYVCQEWSHTYDYKNSHSINAKFEQYPFNFSAAQYTDSTPPPELESGRLLFTSPLEFVDADGDQDVIVNQNVKARMFFENVGDTNLDITGEELNAITAHPFSFVGETNNTLPIVKDSTDPNHYVIRNPYKDLPFHLDGQYLRVSKSYTKEPQGGQFFTVVTGDESAGLPYRNKKVMRNGELFNDVYFQNNFGEITSGVEHTFPVEFESLGVVYNSPPKQGCNYYMVESLFTGKYVTTLGPSEKAFADVVCTGLSYSDVQVGLKWQNVGEGNDDRIRWGNSDDSASGHLFLYGTNRDQVGSVVIRSNDLYDPLTGEFRLFLSKDRLSDDSILTTIRTPSTAS